MEENGDSGQWSPVHPWLKPGELFMSLPSHIEEPVSFLCGVVPAVEIQEIAVACQGWKELDFKIA